MLTSGSLQERPSRLLPARYFCTQFGKLVNEISEPIEAAPNLACITFRANGVGEEPHLASSASRLGRHCGACSLARMPFAIPSRWPCQTQRGWIYGLVGMRAIANEVVDRRSGALVRFLHPLKLLEAAGGSSASLGGSTCIPNSCHQSSARAVKPPIVWSRQMWSIDAIIPPVALPT